MATSFVVVRNGITKITATPVLRYTGNPTRKVAIGSFPVNAIRRVPIYLTWPYGDTLKTYSAASPKGVNGYGGGGGGGGPTIPTFGQIFPNGR